MHAIDREQGLRLAREFRAKGIAEHSPDLQRLLRSLRTEAPSERFVLFAVQPGKRWILARRSGGQGGSLELFDHKVYDDPDDAEWDVFELRWQARAGAPLPDELRTLQPIE